MFSVQFLEYVTENYLMVQCLGHCNQMGGNVKKSNNFWEMQPLLLHHLQIKLLKV